MRRTLGALASTPVAPGALICLSLLLVACNPTAASPGAARLRALPANPQILFLSNQDTRSSRLEIYAMDAQGVTTRITTTGEQHFVFGIDPSRRYIVATRGSEGHKRVWLLDLETGEETPLTSAEDNAEGRSFSPDGEWVVFWMVRAGQQTSDIYKIRRDGSSLTNITNTPTAHELDPAWSSQGDQIAFVYDDGSPNRFVLKAMRPDGSGVRTIYDPADAVSTAAFPAGVYDPSWSPDDDCILVDKPVAFSGHGGNGGAGVWHILKIRADGTTVEDLTETGELADSALYLPSFSTDGEWILASARRGGEDAAGVSLEIVKMTADGAHVQALTDSPSWEQFAIWAEPPAAGVPSAPGSN